MSNNIFARALANAGSDDQASFLNEFASSLAAGIKVTGGWAEMQSYEIAKNLSVTAVEFLRELIATFEYQQESRAKDRAKLTDVREELRQAEKELQARRESLTPDPEREEP